MEKIIIPNIQNLQSLSKEEVVSINGGAYNLWEALGYLMGVNYAIQKEHAETAPWVGFGSK